MPVEYTYTLPSLLPQLPPWLALLVLLVLQRNRSSQAWWVWVPLLCSLGAQALVRAALDFLPSRTSDIFFQTVHALTFGVAALWLLSVYLGRKPRFVGFLGILFVTTGFSALTFVFAHCWGGDRLEAAPTGMLIGIHALVMSAALSLAGLLCRRGYRPWRLLMWLVVTLIGCTLLLALPFVVLALVQSRGEVPVLEFCSGVLLVAGLCLSALLPFLVLAFANTCYRERLKDLLLLDRVAPPPLLTPSPAAVQPTAQTAPNPPGSNVA